MSLITTEEVLFTEIPGRNGNLGIITLNRPNALNALTNDMCCAMNAQLVQWAKADQIKAVVVRGAGDRAFCAGGDVRHIYNVGRTERALAESFFRDEYRLNSCIHYFPKPYIALLDGITMGGGLGVSVHGSHRIVTERTLMAMPETAIGLFPDVGASYFLSRCPGQIGIYLGLTGARINGSDAIYANLATHFVASNDLDKCVSAIADAEFPGDAKHAVDVVLQKYSVRPNESSLAISNPTIDHCFSGDTVESILQTLVAETGNEWCQATAETLTKKSPTSLKVTLQQLRLGAKLDFDACMKLDYQLVQHFLKGHDFYEGVRAVVVDKDQSPHWQPSELSAVTSEMVKSYFI